MTTSRTRALAIRVVIALCAAVLAGLAGGGQRAEAQTLDESTPADGAVLINPPEELVLTFGDEISPGYLVSAACNNDPYQLPAGTLSSDSLTITIEMNAATPMPAGTCVVEYSVFPPDSNDARTGRFTFSIQNSSASPDASAPAGTATSTTVATTTASTTATDDTAARATPTSGVEQPSSAPMWLGRLLSSLGLAVLFGSFVLIVMVWPEGPEYVVAVNFLRVAWVVAMVGTLLFVIAFAAAAKGESLASGFSPGAWFDLVDVGWSGRAALARLLLCALTGWVVMRPERVIDPTTQLPALAFPSLAMATVGLSRTGGDLAILGVIAGIAHALAIGVWLGAVIMLARVVLAGPGDDDLVHAVRGFGRISGPAIVVALLTGFIQMYRLDGGELFGAGHGRVLLLKVVAVAFMLFIGLSARQVAQHRLARAGDLGASTAGQLRRAFGTEALIGLVVLALSVGLMSFTPPKAPAAATVDFAVQKKVVDETSGLDLFVRLEPGRVGNNRLQVEVLAPETGVSGLTLTFIGPVGSDTPTIVQSIPITGAGIADTIDAVIPFDVAGAWTLQVDGTTSTGALSGAAGSFDIRNADGSLPTSDIGPTPTGAPVTAASTSSPSTDDTATDATTDATTETTTP